MCVIPLVVGSLRNVNSYFMLFVHVSLIILSWDSPFGCSDSSAVVKGGSGKDWKKVLKEWLTLLKEMKNARAFYKGALVKDILLNR